MTIDTRQIERVRDRIAQYMADETRCVMEKYIDAEDLAFTDKVLAAYAATLPREVEVKAWAVLRPNGSIWGLYEQDIATTEVMRERPDYIPVRLTGTAVIKPEV